MKIIEIKPDIFNLTFDKNELAHLRGALMAGMIYIHNMDIDDKTVWGRISSINFLKLAIALLEEITEKKGLDNGNN